MRVKSSQQWETFWDDRGQQTYRVNPLFSELCACSELRKQWKFTRYVCCHLALGSLLLGLSQANSRQSIPLVLEPFDCFNQCVRVYTTKLMSENVMFLRYRRQFRADIMSRQEE